MNNMINSDNAMKLYNNRFLWCIILLALATFLSFIPILVLKDGGSWTFFSLLPLWLITYFFGFPTGLVISFLFSVCKLAAVYATEGDVFMTPKIYVLEYLCACTGFCLGGLLIASNRRCARYVRSIRTLRKKKHLREDNPDSRKTKLPTQVIGDMEKENSTSGLILGYLCGVLFMFICYLIAAPEYEAYPPGLNSFWELLFYDIKYDGSYLLAEAATTVLVLAIPKVREVIFTCKHIAVNEPEDPAAHSF